MNLMIVSYYFCPNVVIIFDLMEIMSVEEYQNAINVEHKIQAAIQDLRNFYEKLEELWENEVFGEELDIGQISWDICDAEYELSNKHKEICESIEKYVKNERERVDDKDVVEEWFKEFHNILFKERKAKNGKVQMYVSIGDADESYKEFRHKSKNRKSAPMKINKTMLRLGFTEVVTRIDGKSIRIWMLEKTKYDSLMSRIDNDDDLELVEFEDEVEDN